MRYLLLVLFGSLLLSFFCIHIEGSSTVQAKSGMLQQESEDIEIKLRVFIPSEVVNVPIDLYSPSSMFGGDNRGFSYDQGDSRIEQRVVVTTDERRNPRVSRKQNGIVTTTIYKTSQGKHVEGRPIWWWKLNAGEKGKTSLPPISQPVSDMVEVTRDKDGTVIVSINIRDVGNPYGHGSVSSILEYPAPDAHIKVLIRQCGDNILYKLLGEHDGFPAYELYINKAQVYTYMPILNSIFEHAPLTLAGDGDIDVSKGWNLLGVPGKNIRTATFSLNSYLDTDMFVNIGDTVTIKAWGEIKFGPLVGKGDPDGLYANDNTFPLLPLCTLVRAKHGALIAQTKERNRARSELYFVGRGGTFTSNMSGKLMLWPNDACPDDNSGTFDGCIMISSPLKR